MIYAVVALIAIYISTTIILMDKIKVLKKNIEFEKNLRLSLSSCLADARDKIALLEIKYDQVEIAIDSIQDSILNVSERMALKKKKKD